MSHRAVPYVAWAKALCSHMLARGARWAGLQTAPSNRLAWRRIPSKLWVGRPMQGQGTG